MRSFPDYLDWVKVAKAGLHLSADSLALLYTLFLTVVLLFPFDFYMPYYRMDNEVEWLPDAGGVEFISTGAISSMTPPRRLYESLTSGDGLTIELWFSPSRGARNREGSIVSYSYNHYKWNFTLAQGAADLYFGLRTTGNAGAGDEYLEVRNVFNEETQQHIVVSYDFSQTVVYVNNEERLRSDAISGRFSGWEPSSILTLGNKVTGDLPWMGRIHKFAVYNRSLSQQEIAANYEGGTASRSEDSEIKPRSSVVPIASYFFIEGKGDVVLDRSGISPALDLRIPKKILVKDKVYLQPPYRNFTLSFYSLRDLAVNVAVFIPLGFLFHRAVRRRIRTSLRAVCFVLAIGLLFTLTVETLQFFIESRSSSMTDVINNTIGIAFGIALAKLRPGAEPGKI